jgi:RNA-directed DNA polymerase
LADVLTLIAEELTLPREVLAKAVAHAASRYRMIVVPKRSGGSRLMLQPAAELKPVLAWLDRKLFCQLRVSDLATAFRQGRSILDNARAHMSSTYSVRVDLVNFFPSIRSADLFLLLRSETAGLPDWTYSSEAVRLLRQACFDRKDQLPIGYLTSPRIANAVMYGIDTRLLRIVGEREVFGAAKLTRYADDFVFSTDKRGACAAFVHAITRLLHDTVSPRLSINQAKTRFMSRQRGSTLITGLRVKENAEIGVHPEYRDHLRLLMKLYANNRLCADDVQRLRGHLAFVKHADPGLFTRLSFKYCDEFYRLQS